MKIKRTTCFRFIRLSILLSSALLMIIFPSVSVVAIEGRLSDDPEFLISNGINVYDPKSGSCVSPGVNYSTRMDLPTLVGSDNAEKIWNFLKQEGFSDDQAAGIMGNIRQESNYNPDAEEGNGIGYGLIQWSFTRRNGYDENQQHLSPPPIGGLEKAALDAGVPASDLGFQLGYLKHEASTFPLHNWRNLFETFSVTSEDNAWDSLKKIDGITQTTTFFHDAFERSGDYDNHGGIEHRIKFAKEVYENYTGESSSDDSSKPVSTAYDNTDCAPFAGGDLIQTLLAYAHPTYSEGQYPLNPMPKPAYLEAATKAASEGKFVGGGAAEIGVPGIDCGGFVSLLLVNSGFEPDYNYGLDWGKGACNQAFPTVCYGTPAGEYAGQQGWAMKNWDRIGKGGEDGFDVADLRPGDVAFSNGHTFVYVGQVDGFESQYASSSYSESRRREGKYSEDASIYWRAPMAAGDWGGGGESATNPEYTWYGRR